MRNDDRSQTESKRSDDASAPTPLRPKVLAVGVALLILATSLAVASVSPWLVPPYLALMAWMLFAPGRSAEAHVERKARREHQASARAERRAKAKGKAVSATTRSVSGEAPSPRATPSETKTAVTDDPPPSKPRRARRRGKKKSLDELPDVTWVRIGPGKFVRHESPIVPGLDSNHSPTDPPATPPEPEPEPEPPTEPPTSDEAQEPSASAVETTSLAPEGEFTAEDAEGRGAEEHEHTLIEGSAAPEPLHEEVTESAVGTIEENEVVVPSETDVVQEMNEDPPPPWFAPSDPSDQEAGSSPDLNVEETEGRDGEEREQEPSAESVEPTAEADPLGIGDLDEWMARHADEPFEALARVLKLPGTEPAPELEPSPAPEPQVDPDPPSPEATTATLSEPEASAPAPELEPEPVEVEPPYPTGSGIANSLESYLDGLINAGSANILEVDPEPEVPPPTTVESDRVEDDTPEDFKLGSVGHEGIHVVEQTFLSAPSESAIPLADGNACPTASDSRDQTLQPFWDDTPSPETCEEPIEYESEYQPSSEPKPEPEPERTDRLSVPRPLVDWLGDRCSNRGERCRVARSRRSARGRSRPRRTRCRPHRSRRARRSVRAYRSRAPPCAALVERR